MRWGIVKKYNKSELQWIKICLIKYKELISKADYYLNLKRDSLFNLYLIDSSIKVKMFDFVCDQARRSEG